MDAGIGTAFDKKTEYVTHFGEELDWAIEKGEFVNLSGVGGYQTADETDEDPYPNPTKRSRLEFEEQEVNIEETYYWFLNFLRQELGYPMIDKIYDIYTASEASAFWGSQGQKLGIQQDRGAQFLKGVGELVKSLFAIIRGIRILDERIDMYNQWETSKSADISLKHLYVSLVEGGGNNPDSVYALATRLGYTVLPDLFFNTHIYDVDKLDKAIESGEVKEFNKNVRTVLRRKLFQYIVWKQKTEKELKHRRKFELQYLRQHWKIIQLYMSWAKPYLRHARRMAHNPNTLQSPDIIGAFDTTRIEIEVLAKKPLDIRKKDGHFKCILITFSYQTKPRLSYNPQYQQQQVAHTGKAMVTMRAYGWHEKDIEAYKKMRQEEDIEMLKAIDVHVASAFDALGEEFEKYLLEAGEEGATRASEKVDKEKVDAAKAAKKAIAGHDKYRKFGPLEPFMEVGDGFVELGKSFFTPMPGRVKKDHKNVQKGGRDNDKLEKAGKGASKEMGVLYTVYKKTHGMLAW